MVICHLGFLGTGDHFSVPYHLDLLGALCVFLVVQTSSNCIIFKRINAKKLKKKRKNSTGLKNRLATFLNYNLFFGKKLLHKIYIHAKKTFSVYEYR